MKVRVEGDVQYFDLDLPVVPRIGDSIEFPDEDYPYMVSSPASFRLDADGNFVDVVILVDHPTSDQERHEMEVRFLKGDLP